MTFVLDMEDAISSHDLTHSEHLNSPLHHFNLSISAFSYIPAFISFPLSLSSTFFSTYTRDLLRFH